jgi:hypothetical protein
MIDRVLGKEATQAATAIGKRLKPFMSKLIPNQIMRSNWSEICGKNKK